MKYQRELEIPELEDWVRVYLIPPHREYSGKLKSFVNIGPIRSGSKLSGITAQVGPWQIGVCRWKWWKN